MAAIIYLATHWQAWNQILLPIAREWCPDLVIVSVG